jgi:putative hydrolase of the HAD superfamily
MSLKVIVFDLDDTLIDTSRDLIPIKDQAHFNEFIQTQLHLFPQALNNLIYLHKKYDLYLVTFGDPKLQKLKVSSLKIEEFFKNQYYPEAAKHETKKQFFQIIREQHPNIPNSAFLSVGNRKSTDIREAKELGFTTCLYDYGEHRHEATLLAADHPDFLITHHQELVPVCRL